MIPAQMKEYYKKVKPWVSILFFCLGFGFDAFVLRRIDEIAVLAQQAAYIFVSGLLIGIEIWEARAVEGTTVSEGVSNAASPRIVPPKWFEKVWSFREPLLHFLLGTLLNSYAIFYFKSASSLTSFLFIIILIILLTLNEFKRFGAYQTRVHAAFWSLCVVSYSAVLSPILLGSLGVIPFLAGMMGSGAFFIFATWPLKRKLSAEPTLFRSHVRLPFLSVVLAFSLLYLGHAIPPVPLSVKYMGIFHDVRKENGEYIVSYSRPDWKFWQMGDQTFLARPGDAIFCFVRIFSPSRFSERLQVRWLYWSDHLGWQSSDAIPMQIEGGREEGFRGVTKKMNFQPGKWRVQIETMDDREVGRLGFKVEMDESTEPREMKTETH